MRPDLPNRALQARSGVMCVPSFDVIVPAVSIASDSVILTFYGRDDSDILVIRAPSIALNPTLDAKIVDQACSAPKPEMPTMPTLPSDQGCCVIHSIVS